MLWSMGSERPASKSRTCTFGSGMKVGLTGFSGAPGCAVPPERTIPFRLNCMTAILTSRLGPLAALGRERACAIPCVPSVLMIIHPRPSLHQPLVVLPLLLCIFGGFTPMQAADRALVVGV